MSENSNLAKVEEKIFILHCDLNVYLILFFLFLTSLSIIFGLYLIKVFGLWNWKYFCSYFYRTEYKNSLLLLRLLGVIDILYFCDKAIMALIGVRVGEYLLVEYIGSGGYGEVYVGRSEETMAEVAIKLELCGNRTPILHNEYYLYKVIYVECY